MTTETKIERNKLSLQKLGAELTNVSKACKIMGYARQQFYKIRLLEKFSPEFRVRHIETHNTDNQIVIICKEYVFL